MIDHLFRHQYGKLVSILTRFFGLQHLETIEDAVQDTFVSALKAWQGSIPEHPEAWLTQAAKNRVLDLFRKLSAEDQRIAKMDSGVATIAIHELFLDHEMEDSVLRMIFTACNPLLHPKDQIAFALKTVSGFSGKEIAAALLLKEDTVKKRLSRARKTIRSTAIAFEIPEGAILQQRLDRVLEVIYLIFNEGFHSNRKDILIREDLCGEAMRLTQLLLQRPLTATPKVQAVFALFCFQSARLRSRVNAAREVISLRDQDRSKWYLPLITLGHRAMERAVEADVFSPYHYEAAIAAEHTRAQNFDTTDWGKILKWYEQLHALEPSAFHLLNLAMVQLQLKAFDAVAELLQRIDPNELEQRQYLYYGAYAEFAFQTGDQKSALRYIDQAIEATQNAVERAHLTQKKALYGA